MSERRSNKGSTEYGYKPKKSINEGYQPSEERGYQPSLKSETSSSQPDNPPSGGSSSQSSSDE